MMIELWGWRKWPGAAIIWNSETGVSNIFSIQLHYKSGNMHDTEVLQFWKLYKSSLAQFYSLAPEQSILSNTTIPRPSGLNDIFLCIVCISVWKYQSFPWSNLSSSQSWPFELYRFVDCWPSPNNGDNQEIWSPLEHNGWLPSWVKTYITKCLSKAWTKHVWVGGCKTSDQVNVL